MADKMLQHQPLRTPNGWSGQSASLVVQANKLFDDLYGMVGRLRKENEELAKRIEELEEGSE